MELIKPMLAKPFDPIRHHKLDLSRYFAELKLDGMRAILYKLDGEVRVFGRSGIEYTKHMTKEFISEMFFALPDNTIVDGELAHVENRIKSYGFTSPVPVVSFNKTMRVMGSAPRVAIEKQQKTPIMFIVFDVLQYNSQDLTGMSNITRRRAVEDIYAWYRNQDNKELLEMVPRSWVPNQASLSSLTNEMRSLGQEGLILKHENGLYIPNKRTNDQIKIKITNTLDAVVCGVTPGAGKFAGTIGAVEFGLYDDQGMLSKVGQCSGMPDFEREALAVMHDKHELIGRVIEVKYYGLLETGSPRHPIYLRMRKDKHPEDCTKDQLR